MKSNICGVYALEEIDGTRCYIGSSSCLQSRKRNHFNELKYGTNHARRVQEIYDQGARFNFRVILQCRKEDLKFYELLVIEKFNPELNIYLETDHKNLTGSKNPMYGKIRPNVSNYNRTRVNPNKGKKLPGTSAGLIANNPSYRPEVRIKQSYAKFINSVVYWGA